MGKEKLHPCEEKEKNSWSNPYENVKSEIEMVSIGEVNLIGMAYTKSYFGICQGVY